MNFIESYYRNKFNQEELEKKYPTQLRVCECKFPIPCQNVVINEGFFSVKRVYREVDYTCPICHRIFKIVA
jgi:hypothetical protein